IYQLRDQNGRQTMQPGGCNIFDDPRDKEVLGDDHKFHRVGPGSPATLLREIGYDAVPQLIPHFDDATLTRSIEFHRDFYFSHHALSVGQCVKHILYLITGRRLESRAAAEAWWAEFQQKGERQILIEEVEKGGLDSWIAAERLIQKYPEDALGPIT